VARSWAVPAGWGWGSECRPPPASGPGASRAAERATAARPLCDRGAGSRCPAARRPTRRQARVLLPDLVHAHRQHRHARRQQAVRQRPRHRGQLVACGRRRPAGVGSRQLRRPRLPAGSSGSGGKPEPRSSSGCCCALGASNSRGGSSRGAPPSPSVTPASPRCLTVMAQPVRSRICATVAPRRPSSPPACVSGITKRKVAACGGSEVAVWAGPVRWGR
jgi:hypothetical protein